MVTQSTDYIDKENVYKESVKDLLKASGVDLSNGGGFEEFEQFQ
jgi:hypothetical protein